MSGRLLAGVALAALLCGAPAMAAAGQGAAQVPASATSRAAEIDALFSPYAVPGSPGLAVGIAVGGKPVYSGGFGEANLDDRVPITADTVFHVASVSKQFTAFTIALLAEEGKIDVNADVHTYLPELPDFGARVTVLQMIQHTSGLKDQWALLMMAGHSWSDVLTQDEVLELIKRNPTLDFEPGTAYAYSNTNYTLLAEIVARVSGKTFRQFCEERIFQPLGMDHSLIYDDVTEVVPGRAQSYSRQSDGRWARSILSYDTWGATSLHTTIGDLLKWGGNFGKPVVGDAALIKRITTPGRLSDGRPIAYGYGIVRDVIAGREAYVHSGNDAAFYAYFAYFPKEDTTIVIASNTGPERRKAITDVARTWFGGDGPLAPAPRVADARARFAADLPGGYIGGPDDAFVEIVSGADGLEWKRLSERTGKRLRASRAGAEQVDQAIAYAARRDARGTLIGLAETLTLNPLVPDTRQYRRASMPAVSERDLQALTGAWRSEALDVTYQFTVEDGRLVGHDLWGARKAVFVPTDPDRFDSGDGVLRSVKVRRDASGAPEALVIGAGRAQGIVFRR